MILLPAALSSLFLLSPPPSSSSSSSPGARQRRGSSLAATPAAAATNVASLSQELQTAVAQHFERNGLLPSSSGDSDSDSIVDLMDQLVEAQVTFDPAAYFDATTAPLFAVKYVDLGPGKEAPSWAKYTTKGSLVGQQYRLMNNNSKNGEAFPSDEDSISKSIETLQVINYAEAFGGAVKLFTKGTAELSPTATSQIVDSSNNAKINNNKSSNPLAAAMTQFWGPSDGTSSKDEEEQQSPPVLVQCPVDYVIPPESEADATMVLLGSFKPQFKIPGEGTVRVLYHDNALRILEAPPDEANWEPRGIRTIQVRCDDPKQRDELEALFSNNK